MKTDALKKLIKEAVKEAIQDELKNILLEAVKSNKQPIKESYQVSDDAETLSRSNRRRNTASRRPLPAAPFRHGMVRVHRGGSG